MIPEFLVILTNCISDYWVVSPPKKRSKSPSNPPIRPPKQTWPSSMGFQAPKVLKVTGYHRLQYLNSMTQCGILPIHQASKDDLSITQTTYINGISIFISYNIVHPDMWHNQLYSIHIHIYIYIPICHTIIYYIPLLFGIPQQASSGVVVQLVVDLHVPGRQGHGQKVDHQRWAKVAQAMNTLVPSSVGTPLQSCCKKDLVM